MSHGHDQSDDQEERKSKISNIEVVAGGAAGGTPFAFGSTRQASFSNNAASAHPRFTPGGTTPGLGRGQSMNQSDVHHSHVDGDDQPQKKITIKQRRSKLACAIASFNYAESILVFLLMLNAVVFPNFVSCIYFGYSLILTLMAMTRNQKTIKTKFSLSLMMALFAFAVGVCKIT